MMRLSLALVAGLAACSSAGHAGRRHHGHRRHRTSSREVERQNDSVYRPINVVRSEDTIQARDGSVLANLDPSDRAHMAFGRVGRDTEIHLADMTLFADQDLPIVMMEAFEGLTSAVDCQGTDGQMSLSFKSAEAFNHAINSWKFIHEDTDRQFLLIANHDSCGPKGERQAYKITDIDNDEVSHIVYLAASPAGWEEVAGSFEMEFGKSVVTPSQMNHLRTRGAIDWLDESFDDIDIGDTELSKSATFPLSVGEKDAETLLFEDITVLPPALKLSCVNCFVDAKFKTTGSLKVTDFKLETLLLEVSPQDYHSIIEMRADIAQNNPALDWLEWNKAIIEVPIPGAGIVIPKIFTVGAKAALNIQGSAGVAGTGSITFGANTTLPNGSKVTIDLIHPDRSGVSGFESADVQSIFDMDKTALTANIIAGPQPALTFGIEILDRTGIEAGLTFGTPTLNLNVTSGYNENGWCSPTDPITSGIKTVSAASFDIVLAVSAKIKDELQPIYDDKLVNIPIATFLDECWPVAGITPPNNGTNPTVPIPSPSGSVTTSLPPGSTGRVYHKIIGSS